MPFPVDIDESRSVSENINSIVYSFYTHIYQVYKKLLDEQENVFNSSSTSYDDVFKPLFNIKDTLIDIKNNSGNYKDLLYDVKFDGIFWSNLKEFVNNLPTIGNLSEGNVPGNEIDILIRKSQPYADLSNIVNNFGSARGIEKGNTDFILQRIRKELKDNINQFIDNVCHIAYNVTDYEKQRDKLVSGADKLVRVGQDVTPQFIDNLYDVFDNLSSALGRSAYSYFGSYTDVKEFMIQTLTDLSKRLPEDEGAINRLKDMIDKFRKA